MRLLSIPPLSDPAIAEARTRAELLARPPGSLGRLEALAVRLAGMRQGWDRPLTRCSVVLMAADHGVAAEGVSAYPASVTSQMLATFAARRASIDAIAAAIGAEVTIVDMGVRHAVASPAIVDRRIAAGTNNIAVGAAMTLAQAEACVEAGVGIARDLVREGAELIAGGEMGIGNTTPASAIVAAVTGRPASEVVGAGSGIDGEALGRKVAVVEAAVRRWGLGRRTGLRLLEELGGFEIGGLAGVYLGAAAERVPVVLDGHIATAAALVAAQIHPAVTSYLIASHRSTEPGHAHALVHLGLEPLLDLDLRLGEGTGAALAMPLVRCAAAVLRDVATLEEVMDIGLDGDSS